MKAIITGANGTVGSALKAHLLQQDWSVTAWDRSQVPIDNYAQMEAFVRAENPGVLFHLATASTPTGRPNESWLVNYEWTSELAWICRTWGVRFLFTSSVMVFTDDAVGPFTPDSVPDAKTGYGFEKKSAEIRTRYQNPNAVIARIGWQIGEAAGSNNMIDFFETQMRENGHISASTAWYPACSFITDIVVTLTALAQGEPGLYLVNSNTRWTFHEIAMALNAHHGNQWLVKPNADFVYDQRMLDPRVSIPALDHRLDTLK